MQVHITQIHTQTWLHPTSSWWSPTLKAPINSRTLLSSSQVQSQTFHVCISSLEWRVTCLCFLQLVLPKQIIYTAVSQFQPKKWGHHKDIGAWLIHCSTLFFCFFILFAMFSSQSAKSQQLKWSQQSVKCDWSNRPCRGLRWSNMAGTLGGVEFLLHVK